MKRWIDKYGYWTKVPAMLMLGMFFITAGVGKLVYQSASFEAFPFLESLPFAQVFYMALPYIEIIIGALLIHGIMVRFVSIIASMLVALFAVSNITLLSMGKGADLCGCFGMAGRLTYIDALVIDAMMMILAITVLICDRNDYFNIKPWFLEVEQPLEKQQA